MQQRLLISLFLLCLTLPVMAQVPADFYATSVSVADRQPDNFRKGLREALVQVLSKVSGAPADIVRSRPNLVQDLAQGDKLASQFAYYNHKRMGSNGKEVTELRIKASFPEARIMALLQKGGLTFWAPGRPELQFWVLLQAAGSARWLDEDHLYRQALQQLQNDAMLQWGFTVSSRYPSALNPDRLWHGDSSYNEAVLQQLDGKPVLLARIDHLQASRVTGTVTLLGQAGSQLLQADTIGDWNAQAMAWVSQQLAARHAVQLLSADSEVMLSVTGIENYAAYEQLLSYVESIDIVRRVYVLSARGQELRLAVSFKTEVEQLQRRLLAGGKLTPSLIAENSIYQLHMHWKN